MSIEGDDEGLGLAGEPVRGSWRLLVTRFVTLLTGEAVARVFGLVTVLVLARRLGPEGFGVVSYGLVVVAWAGLVTDAGTETLATRDVARAPDRFRRTADAVLGLRITLATIGAIVIGGVAFALAPSRTNGEVYALFMVVLLAAALNLRWVTLGVDGARLVATGAVAAQVVLTLAVLLLVHDHDDVVRVPLLYGLAELAFAVVVAIGLVPRFGLVRPRIELDAWWTTLRGGAPLAVSACARGALHSWDLVVIGVVLGPGLAGEYSAGSRPTLFVLTVIGLFYLSFLASYSAADRSTAAPILARSVRTGAGISIVAAAALTALAGPLVALLFGGAYTEAALALSILAWKIPISAVAAPFNAVLVARDRQLLLMRNTIVAALFDLVAVVAAALAGGIAGVAVASVAAAAVLLVLNVRACVRERLVPPVGHLLRGRPAVVQADR